MTPCVRFLSIAALGLLASLATIPLSGCRPDSATAGDPPAAAAQPGTRAQGPGKRALIVAISKYEPTTLWSKINSTNDIPLVQEALRAQGFQEIHVLPERDANAKGIRDAFQKYLIDPSVEGDIAVFHYSGHGQQITDDDGDEVDGYDEALVPYDAPMNPGLGYDGSKHLRDDDLHDLVQKLRDKVKSENTGRNGNVVVFLDSCFSGTGARGDVRGGADPIGPPRPGFKEVTRGQMGSGLFSRGEMVAEDAGLAPYIVFSAARADQVDKEIVDPTRKVLVGPLSWAVSRALLTLRGEKPTYRHLFANVQSYMREELVPGEPQLEGDADTKIFSGQAVKQAPFVKIASVDPSGKKVFLSMGSLGNLLPGAKVEIHKAGTLEPKPSSRLAHGKVEAADPFEAVVRLDKIVSRGQLEKARAFVTRYAFGDLRMRVQVKDLGDPALQSEIVETIREEIPSVELVDSVAEVIVALDSTGPSPTVSAVTATGTPVLRPTDRRTPDLADTVCNRLLDLARNRYLSRLSFDDPRLRYRFEITPVEVSQCTNPLKPTRRSCQVRALDRRRFVSAGNQMQLPIGTFYTIRVHPGEIKAFGTLLDLMPDGRIQIYWPPPNQNQQFKTNGPTELDGLYRVTEPPGIEKLLFIATQASIDFEPFRTAQTFQGRGKVGGDALEKLGPFAPLFDDIKVRDRGEVLFSLDGIATQTLQYTVAER